MEGVLGRDEARELIERLGKDLIIPDGYIRIEEDAFSHTKDLSSVKIHGGIKSIGSFAFASCKRLERVQLEEGIKNIGDYAFYGCYAMRKIEIPSSVVKIHANAFWECTGLKEISVSADNGYYESYNGVLLDKSGRILVVCPEAIEECKLPEGVEVISANAFSGCTMLRKVEIPNSVKSIGQFAFFRCYGLEEKIDIPDGVMLDEMALVMCNR